MAVLLIGTLDTKGEEYRYVRDRLRAGGIAVLTADAGIIGPPAFQPDIPRQDFFAAGGSDIAALQAGRDRGKAVAAAAEAAARLAEKLYQSGQLTGLMGLGGSAGTTIATAAMRAVPLGIPKLMVSTLASGQVQPYVGTRDILMMHAVVDIAGLNRISREILDTAVAAMVGMVRDYERRRNIKSSEGHALSGTTTEAQADSTAAPTAHGLSIGGGSLPPLAGASCRPLIAATMFGVTTPCVQAARQRLEAAGYEVVVFHATGTGGRTMEELIRDGWIHGVLDLTTTELADELVGGILSAGPDRLTAAALKGIPQVISVGALDMVNFGPLATVPEQFRTRRLHIHNPNVTLMRTTPQEMDRLGKEIAEKASAARGPTAIVLPLRGVSAIDAEGQPFWWPEADSALFASIRHWLAPQVRLVELDLHINDPAFAYACADVLLEMLAVQYKA
ncbi:MAG: Tm-1-like ATP-binding domain-containing protein [Gemmataceae bacterium]|nr:Tm-1-like ATP-binding domain-containing protein [Gemmataceae bacterium]MDW8243719.1 Tm-1-like ATP-binding domain-containing protein [Thermogemmata sp.]